MDIFPVVGYCFLNTCTFQDTFQSIMYDNDKLTERFTLHQGGLIIAALNRSIYKFPEVGRAYGRKL